MAVVLLVGLLLNRFFGWWWADPLAGLALVYFLVREGQEAFHEAESRRAAPVERRTAVTPEIGQTEQGLVPFIRRLSIVYFFLCLVFLIGGASLFLHRFQEFPGSRMVLCVSASSSEQCWCSLFFLLDSRCTIPTLFFRNKQPE
jgi:hypothetical protein